MGSQEMRNSAMKKDLTGMGDFFQEVEVSAEGTAFIHGRPWLLKKLSSVGLNEGGHMGPPLQKISYLEERNLI